MRASAKTAAGFRIVEIQTPHFSTRCQLGGRAITVSMRGNADSDMKSGLESVLRDLDREAKVHAVSEVVFNMTELYFMTSSCISTLVRWMSGVSQAELPYTVLFRTNPSLPWQRRALGPLCTLAPGLARVD
jgi:hypothetical protein